MTDKDKNSSKLEESRFLPLEPSLFVIVYSILYFVMKDHSMIHTIYEMRYAASVDMRYTNNDC